MTKAEAKKAVQRYLSRAWPVSSLTRGGCWRAAWAASHIPGIGLVDFENLVTASGFTPKQYGEQGPYILRLPGRPKVSTIECEGVT